MSEVHIVFWHIAPSRSIPRTPKSGSDPGQKGRPTILVRRYSFHSSCFLRHLAPPVVRLWSNNCVSVPFLGCLGKQIRALADWNSIGHRNKSLILTTAVARPSRRRAERAISANLIHFCRPVQQLLVRVIFLPGISDSGKSICHFTSHLANHLADAEGSFRRTGVKQNPTYSSASSAGTWMQA
jgi:hypothetical protein